MKRFLKTLLALSIALAAACPATAATVVFYTHLRLFGGTGLADTTSVTDIAVDSANRTWFVTTQTGATALDGSAVDPSFPLFSSLQGFTSISSVAFGKVGVDSQENFFIGSNATTQGILFGRMLTSPNYGTTFTLNSILNSASLSTAVNALSVNQAGDSLWVATNNGVGRFALTLNTNNTPDSLLLAGAEGPLRKITAANPPSSGVAAFTASTRSLFMLGRNGSAITRAEITNTWGTNGIGGITTGPNGSLWVAEATGPSTLRNIFIYSGASLTAFAADTNIQPTPQVIAFDPGAAGSASIEARDIRDIAINPITNEVWLATTKGAYFQKPLVLGGVPTFNPKTCNLGLVWPSPADDQDATGASCAGDGNGWHPVPQMASEALDAARENFGAVNVDIAGNAALGSDKGVRAVVARSLTLSGTRFIGDKARATVTLEDESLAGADATVNVSVGGKAIDIIVKPNASNVYTFSFGFSLDPGANPVPDPHIFPVTSSTTGVPIIVKYTFKDGAGNPRDLIALASWANIVPFQDDLMIGGPCMLNSLVP